MRYSFASRFQRVSAVVLVAITLAPLSVAAESRPRSGTDMRRLAAELEAALRRVHGSNASVEVEGERARSSRTSTPPARVPSSSLDPQAVVDEMNVYRRQYGLRPLRLDVRLSRAADDRISDMFSKRYFDHVAPDGTEPFVWAGRNGYRYSTIGENLAAGQLSVREVVSDWMRSPGHRANILGRSFEDCGIAIAAGSPVGNTRGYTFAAFYAAAM